MNTETDQSTIKHLLLVDDDRVVLSTLSAGLTQAGYQVSTAESAEEAEVLLASGFRPALAIVDVRMPGNGGVYLAQRLRELDHIPFVMLSAYNTAEIVAQATKYGALSYAVKPMDVGQLLPIVEAALARANDLQELRATREQLQRALDGDRNINIATGIVMVSFNLSRAEAFCRLRDTARRQRRKLADFATDIAAAGESMSAVAPSQPNRRSSILDSLIDRG